jgi:hypothetical protein
MKTRNLLAALAACALACTPALAQKDAPGKPAVKPANPAKPAAKQPAGNPSEDAMMKAWMDAGTPGEGQKNIAQLAGDWDAIVKVRMAPEGPWQESKGSMSAKMMFEGRYLHSMYNGEMMGMPFQGTMILAYNNVTKTYESTWCDSMSTGIMYSTGTYDSAKKTFSLKGDMADPTQGGKKKTTRVVTTILAPDKHIEEFFEPGPEGKEFKSMEITYTRSAGGDMKAPPAKPAHN